jgi:hypothetical protein
VFSPTALKSATSRRRDTAFLSVRGAPGPRPREWRSGAPPSGLMQSAHRFPHKSRTQLADAIKKEWLDLPVVETAFHETERMGLPAAQRLRKRKDRNQKPRLLPRGSRQVEVRLLADSAVGVRMRLAHSKLRPIRADPRLRWGLALRRWTAVDLEFRPWGYSWCEY